MSFIQVFMTLTVLKVNKERELRPSTRRSMKRIDWDGSPMLRISGERGSRPDNAAGTYLVYVSASDIASVTYSIQRNYFTLLFIGVTIYKFAGDLRPIKPVSTAGLFTVITHSAGTVYGLCAIGESPLEDLQRRQDDAGMSCGLDRRYVCEIVLRSATQANTSGYPLG